METITITADQLRGGDYIASSYENGRRPAWIGIGSVSRNIDGTIVAYTATTSLEYQPADLVTIESR